MSNLNYVFQEERKAALVPASQKIQEEPEPVSQELEDSPAKRSKKRVLSSGGSNEEPPRSRYKR